MPKFLKSEHFWILICTVAYIISGVTDNETVWQVVVAVAAYTGGTSLKEFTTNLWEVLKKVDAILDDAGISWEEILRDVVGKKEPDREELIP